MKTLETDIEVCADGSLKLLSPLPEWLKPGLVHVILSVTDGTAPKPKRVIPTPTPEMFFRGSFEIGETLIEGRSRDVKMRWISWVG